MLHGLFGSHSYGRYLNFIVLALFLYGFLVGGVIFGYSATFVAIVVWIGGGILGTILFPRRHRRSRRSRRSRRTVRSAGPNWETVAVNDSSMVAVKSKRIEQDKYCENCGTKAEDPEAKFCMQCGASLA